MTVEQALTILLTFMAQCYFALQLFIVTKKSVRFLVLCMIFPIAAFAAGIVVISRIFINDSASLTEGLLFWSLGIGQTLDTAADLMSTGLMIYVLWNSRTAFKKTNSLLKRLLVYIVNRGILLATCQGLFAITFLADSAHWEFMFFHFLLAKLYTNTMLAMLNARTSTRQDEDSGTSFDMSTHAVSSRRGNRMLDTQHERSLKPVEVFVQHEQGQSDYDDTDGDSHLNSKPSVNIEGPEGEEVY